MELGLGPNSLTAIAHRAVHILLPRVHLEVSQSLVLLHDVGELLLTQLAHAEQHIAEELHLQTMERIRKSLLLMDRATKVKRRKTTHS